MINPVEITDTTDELNDDSTLILEYQLAEEFKNSAIIESTAALDADENIAMSSHNAGHQQA